MSFYDFKKLTSAFSISVIGALGRCDFTKLIKPRNDSSGNRVDKIDSNISDAFSVSGPLVSAMVFSFIKHALIFEESPCKFVVNCFAC